MTQALNIPFSLYMMTHFLTQLVTQYAIYVKHEENSRLEAGYGVFRCWVFQACLLLVSASDSVHEISWNTYHNVLGGGSLMNAIRISERKNYANNLKCILSICNMHKGLAWLKRGI